MGRLFTEIGNEEDVKKLLDAMVGNDVKAFKQFVDRLIMPDDLEFPMLGKCFWLSETIDQVVAESRAKNYKAIRLELSKEEELSRNQCIFENSSVGRIVKRDAFGFDREIIEDRNLLECMERHGLIEEVTIYENVNSIFQNTEAPRRLCF
jgi:hypothetical protein